MSRKSLTVIDGNGTHVHIVPDTAHKPWTLLGVTISQDELGNKTMQHPILKDPDTNEPVTSITSWNGTDVWTDFLRKTVAAYDVALARYEAEQAAQGDEDASHSDGDVADPTG